MIFIFLDLTVRDIGINLAGSWLLNLDNPIFVMSSRIGQYFNLNLGNSILMATLSAEIERSAPL